MNFSLNPIPKAHKMIIDLHQDKTYSDSYQKKNRIKYQNAQNFVSLKRIMIVNLLWLRFLNIWDNLFLENNEMSLLINPVSIEWEKIIRFWYVCTRKF